jgi:hypothetical protein
LAVALFSYGKFSFNVSINKDTSKILSQIEPINQSVFSRTQLLELPNSIQKWLIRSGAVDRENIYLGKIEQKMSIKMKPDQQTWYSAKALQYTNIVNPSFIWTVDMEMNKVMKIMGRDKFIDGKGEMLIKMNALINLVKAKGEKINESTLQRYIGEMVWFPSLATSPHISWEQIDEYSARATMNYKGTVGSGTFFFNEDGDFVKFSAKRFKDNEPEAQRYEWVLTVDEYKIFESIKVPSKMKATWKLEEGDWTWLELEITDLKYNENIR